MKAVINSGKVIKCSVSQNKKIDSIVKNDNSFCADFKANDEINAGATQRGPQGVPGNPGVGIEKIEPVAQQGYDITYRIYFTDGTYFDYVVSNGTGSLSWLQINQADWVQEGNKYKYTYSGSYGVLAVFNGTVANRNKVECDINLQGGITYIYSLNAFDGYALTASVENAVREQAYIYKQQTPSDIWIINHNLNALPTVDITDSAGTVVKPNEIIYNDNNTVTVTFITDFSGKAILNYTR